LIYSYGALVAQFVRFLKVFWEFHGCFRLVTWWLKKRKEHPNCIAVSYLGREKHGRKKDGDFGRTGNGRHGCRPEHATVNLFSVYSDNETGKTVQTISDSSESLRRCVGDGNLLACSVIRQNVSIRDQQGVGFEEDYPEPLFRRLRHVASMQPCNWNWCENKQ